MKAVAVTRTTPQSVFCYGTLMAPDVITTLLRRRPASRPATIRRLARHPVKSHVFPGLIRAENSDHDSVVAGILYHDLSPGDLQVLDWFEDKEYTRQDGTVQVVNDQDENIFDVPTQYYLWTNSHAELDLTQDWDFDAFCTTKLDWYLQHVVRPCRAELDRHGYGSTTSSTTIS